MDEVFDTLSKQWEEMTGHAIEANDEALAELSALWKNSSMGQFEFSAAGLGDAVSVAKDQAWREYNGFVSAVDWEDKWLMYLGGFHGVLWLVFFGAIIFGASQNFKVAFFVLIAGLCGSAPYLNSYAADHWEQFSKQNYFDERGVFMSVMWSVPLLVLLFAVLLLILSDLCSLMVQLKVQQIKQQRRRKAKAEAAAGAAKDPVAKKED
eukprot:TRINITY_DN1036_c0_g1_i1.p1 TRINITY_DN1036_c0_g1~~TRINITY_DN1036_c0_g1_i1.p1  ORF type:complete len:226 (+),score=96.28 TRINITY_DN1036_c0_g1_i1:57-680(+)